MRLPGNEEPQLTTTTEKLRISETSIISLGLVLVYLLLFPSGKGGLYLTLAALALGIYGANRETLGVACLIFGMPIAGAIVETFGIYGVGGKIALALGMLLLFSFRNDFLKTQKKFWHPVLWLLWTTFILYVAYKYGPQSGYSRIKLIWFVITTTIGMIGLYFIMYNPRVNLWQLGKLATLCAAVYLSARMYIQPSLKPASIFQIAGIKSVADELMTNITPDALSTTACMGLAFSLGAVLDKKPNRLHIISLVLITVIVLLILNSCGQRKYLPFPFIAAVSIVLCRPLNRPFALKMATGTVLALLMVIINGLTHEIVYITDVFDKEETLSHRLNRDTVWDYAIFRISERPLLGHGLGGYSPEYEGMYPHNLILELLSETGFVGTILILAPPILFFIIRSGRRFFLMRLAGGGTAIPLLLLYIIVASFTADITHTSVLFSYIAAVWANSKDFENKISVPKPLLKDIKCLPRMLINRMQPTYRFQRQGRIV